MMAFAKADELYLFKKEKLKTNKKQDWFQKYGLDSLDEQALDKDKNVAAINNLYEEQLIELAHRYYLIEAEASKYSSSLSDLEQTQSLLKTEKANLAVIATMSDQQKKGADFSKVSSMFELNIKGFEKNEEKTETDLKRCIKKICTLINEYQEYQIKANLFANEAYINNSAVKHVVSGIQMRDTTVLDKKQMVMGSVLQQIGFRLLHAEQLRLLKISESQILYQVSKYGYRIAEMIFGTHKNLFAGNSLKTFTDEELHSIASNGKLNDQNQEVPILYRLSKGEKSFYDNFNFTQYQLLNQDLRFFNVKKSEAKLDEKVNQLETLLNEFIFKSNNPDREGKLSKFEIASIKLDDINSMVDAQEELWLSIAIEIICLTYASKLEQKQALWGVPSLKK